MGQHLRAGKVVAGGDDDGDAVLLAVGKDETAEDRDVEDVACQLGAAPGAEVDHFAIGPAGGQEVDGCRGQGQADEGGLGVGVAGQHEAECERCLLTTLDVVDVGVGAVADDQVGLVDHALGNVAVQVEGHDDAGGGTGNFAGERCHLAVGVVAVGGDHGAVIGDVDGVEGACCLQAGAHGREIAIH